MCAKILVADDEEILREVLKDMLCDFEVIEAENGRRAVELFKEHAPDIVLMDIAMPDMDGIEATRQILSIDPNATVLALTGFSRTKGDDALEAGVKEVISKPIKMRELIAKIQEYLP